MSVSNPCQSCGACCAHFRIALGADETSESAGGCVPIELTERAGSSLLYMKGTNSYPPRCIALRGVVGKHVSCSIYEQRPQSCREFNIYEPDGAPNMRCFKLRGITPPG